MKPRPLAIFCLTLFLSLTSLAAQSWQQIEDDFHHFAATGQNLGERIWQADATDWHTFAVTGAVVGLLSLADKPTRQFAGDHKSDFNDRLFAIDDYYGAKWYMAGGISGLYAAGWLSGSGGLRKTSLLTAEAYFYTALFTVVTKELFGRSRPYTNAGPYDFKPFQFKERNRSFFSGHSSTVMAVSTVMASRVDNLFWKAGWYGLALLTAGARIYHDKHWLSDVTAGALVGYSIGQFVVNNNSNKRIKVSASVPALIHLQIALP